uniref:Uncharacterized protein n=1 Tax=Pararge aegeria TaxID=116150 RepID=S4P145_9NEOP
MCLVGITLIISVVGLYKSYTWHSDVMVVTAYFLWSQKIVFHCESTRLPLFQLDLLPNSLTIPTSCQLFVFIQNQ